MVSRADQQWSVVPIVSRYEQMKKLVDEGKTQIQSKSRTFTK